MLSKRTIIGFAIGSVIMGVGAASLILHIGLITINEDHTMQTGMTQFYTIPAPRDTAQTMLLEGDVFNVTLSSPGDGLQIPETRYEESAKLEWTHAQDGQTRIKIHNTGGTDLHVTGTLVRSADPIWYTYDLMVIISGVVIIGFSMGFTLRKPKGF